MSTTTKLVCGRAVGASVGLEVAHHAGQNKDDCKHARLFPAVGSASSHSFVAANTASTLRAWISNSERKESFVRSCNALSTAVFASRGRPTAR